jgi:hypothetical protein
MTRYSLVAALATACFAVAPVGAFAQGQNPFTNYADPPADQYNQPPVVTPPTTNTNNPGTTGNNNPTQQTNQPTTTAAAVTPQAVAGETATSPTGSDTPTVEAESGEVAEGTAKPASSRPIAVTPAVKAAGPAAKGKLPFTGADLTVLVIVALILLALGTALALGERISRRRSGAPA